MARIQRINRASIEMTLSPRHFMTLSPDEIELAQQIADALEEGIEAGPRMLYGSTFTKADCCKVLMEPLRSQYRIDTLLESLPPRNAKSLRETYDRLLSCFDPAGKLIDTSPPLTTIYRYAKDLKEELRNISQRVKQDSAAAKQKDKPGSNENSKPIDKRFAFEPGQVLFDGRDLDVGTGAVLDITKALVENLGHVVPFQELDENSSKKEASEKIRTAIKRLRKAIKSAKTPVVIKNRKAEGYVMLPSPR